LYVKDCRERVYRLRLKIADHLIGGQVSAAKGADILSTSFEGYRIPSSQIQAVGDNPIVAASKEVDVLCHCWLLDVGSPFGLKKGASVHFGDLCDLRVTNDSNC
jgi:hypothetical protein